MTIDDTCCACHGIHDGLWQGKSLGVNAAPSRSIVYMSDRAVSSRYKRSVRSWSSGDLASGGLKDTILNVD